VLCYAESLLILCCLFVTAPDTGSRMKDFEVLVGETTVRGSNGVLAVSVLVKDKAGRIQ